jgi:hypothetical protein
MAGVRLPIQASASPPGHEVQTDSGVQPVCSQTDTGSHIHDGKLAGALFWPLTFIQWQGHAFVASDVRTVGSTCHSRQAKKNVSMCFVEYPQ